MRTNQLWIVVTVLSLLCLAACQPGETDVSNVPAEKFFALTHFLNENIDAGIVFVSMDGKIQEANQKYLDIIGYTLEEARKLTYEQITPEKWHAMENDLRVKQVMVRGYCDVYEKEYICKDQSVVPISTQAWLVPDKNGEPWRIMGIIKELTPEE
jgi:PAS domain S-box-containing protein